MRINRRSEYTLMLIFQGPEALAPVGQEGRHSMGLLGKVVVARKIGERRDEKKDAKEAKKKEEEKK